MSRFYPYPLRITITCTIHPEAAIVILRSKPHMNAAVYNMLKEKAKVISMSGYVFTTGRGTLFSARNMYREFQRAVKEAGISGRLRFHDLRHTCRTKLGRQGCDIHGIASVLDHSQLKTTTRYVKHNAESKRQIMNRLDVKGEKDGTFQ